MLVQGWLRTLRAVSAAIVAALVCGCASEKPLPAYPVMSDREAVTVIAERLEQVGNFSAECEVILTDERGQRVHLDGAMVASPPEKLRLRAWKAGQVVIDMTATGGRVWVLAPEGGGERMRSVPQRRMVEVLDLLGAAYFRSAVPVAGTVGDGPSATLMVRGGAFGRDDVTCEIDRGTLTPRRFLMRAEAGASGGSPAQSSVLELGDYRVTEAGIVWPYRIRLSSASGEIVIEAHEVTINGDVPPNAFVPPARAVVAP